MMPRLEQAAPAAQPGAPTLATALRRLAEHALSGTSTRQRSGGSKRKAAKMAEKAIDHLVDQAATGEEHAQRKRRLIKGPREFRDLRRDKSKTKAHRRRSPAYISRRSRAGERPQSERGAAHCSEHRKAAGAASQIGMKDEKMPRCERGKAKGGTAGDITPRAHTVSRTALNAFDVGQFSQFEPPRLSRPLSITSASTFLGNLIILEQCPPLAASTAIIPDLT